MPFCLFHQVGGPVGGLQGVIQKAQLAGGIIGLPLQGGDIDGGKDLDLGAGGAVGILAGFLHQAAVGFRPQGEHIAAGDELGEGAAFLHYGIKLNKKKIEQLVKDNVAKLSIKTPSSKTLIQSLSGGNQQKVLISRWLANNPDILIMDEPTRGIDVGAKYEIYQIMIDLAKQGKGIIMISSEMPELIGMSNRILVMCNGHITGEVQGEEATQERIMSYATKF